MHCHVPEWWLCLAVVSSVLFWETLKIHTFLGKVALWIYLEPIGVSIWYLITAKYRNVLQHCIWRRGTIKLGNTFECSKKGILLKSYFKCELQMSLSQPCVNLKVGSKKIKAGTIWNTKEKPILPKTSCAFHHQLTGLPPASKEWDMKSVVLPWIQSVVTAYIIWKNKVFPHGTSPKQQSGLKGSKSLLYLSWFKFLLSTLRTALSAVWSWRKVHISNLHVCIWWWNWP